MADRKSQKLQISDETDGQTELFDAETSLKMVAMLVDTANRASTIGTNLLSINRNKTPEGEMTLEQLVMGERLAG